MTNDLTAALDHAANGHPVYPTRMDGVPLTAHGAADATTDDEQIRTWWSKWPSAKAAVANGKATFFESIATPLIRDHGWKVVPCLPKDKTVHGKLVPKPLEQMSSNLDQIRAWAKKEPAANVAVYAQQIEGGLLFLDMDGARDIREAYRSETGNDFRTLFVRSSVQNGVEKGHWYFLQTPKTRALAKNISEDTTGGWFSLRVKNQYVCSIGSIHPITGKPYEAVDDAPVVPMPDELLDWLKSQAQGSKPAPSTTETPAEHGKLPRGQRYTALISETGRLWARGWGAALTVEAGIKWARENFDVEGKAFDEELVRKEIEHLIGTYPQGDGAGDSDKTTYQDLAFHVTSNNIVPDYGALACKCTTSGFSLPLKIVAWPTEISTFLHDGAKPSAATKTS